MSKSITTASIVKRIDLDITEEALPYVRAAVIIKPSVSDSLVTAAHDIPVSSTTIREISSNNTSIAFKKISKVNSPDKYQVCITANFYIETENYEELTEFYGNQLNITVLLYYLNKQGIYEIKKYKI